jgi:hypothetical protein
MKARNLFAIAIVGMLLGTAFVGFAAKAAIINVYDSRMIYITDTDLDHNDHYVGEQSVMFDVTWMNYWMDSSSTDGTLNNVSCSISTTVRDVHGTTLSTSPISNWVENDIAIAGTYGDPDYMYFYNFEFDIAADAKPDTYNLSVTLHFTDTAGSATETEYIHFRIAERAEVGGISGLIPGSQDLNVDVGVHANATMENIWLNITRPDSAFSWFGTTSATSSAFYHGPMYGGTHSFSYTVSVSASKAAGTYYGTYVAEYVSDDGVRCQETGTVVFQVGQLAMLGATTATTSIDQGTSKVNFTLALRNTGTVNLFNVRLYVDPASADFTFMPADHWEGDQTVSFAWVDVGDLGVGASVNKAMTIGFSTFIPAGMHKLMFGFEGYYYDPDSMSYQPVAARWEDVLSSQNYPVVNMGGTDITLLPGSSTVGGTFIMLNVVDSAIDISLSSTTTLSKGGQLVDNWLSVQVQNYGNIDYDNVVLQMLTNDADSPFLNAVDPTAGYSEEAILSSALYAGSTEYVVIHVTLRQDAEMGVFNVPVTIRAINKDMGTVVDDALVARITVSGVGPKLVITSTTPSKVNPGSNFVLTLTIENQGDDTARNVVMWSGDGSGTDTGNSELNGDLDSPVPLISPLVLPDIAPGDNITVTVQMRSNADMSGGHVYQINLGISYVDSYGDGPDYEEIYQKVSVKSNGMGGSSLGMLFLVLTLVGVVAMIAICVIVLVWARKNWVPKRKKGASPYIVGSEQPPQPPQ